MTRRNKKQRKKSASKPHSYTHTLAWTVVLSLVFSAGLIAGQRMLRRQQTPALVSVSSSKVPGEGASEAPREAPGDGEGGQDLSFSFYEHLGTERPGAAKQAAGEEASGEGALPARYTLQVGSYPSLEQARGKISALRKHGVEVHMVTAEVPERGKVYRVRIGKFHSMDEARQFQGELKRQRDLEAFIMPL